MAGTADESSFFQERREKGLPVVKEPPKFDLESYISNYDGPLRLDRLYAIGSTSSFLAVEAFRLAIAEAKRGKNTECYLRLTEEFQKIAPNDPLAHTDLEWIEQKNREVRAEQEKLEHELKSYKNNLIKESIRMGNEDLGHFFYACGDYNNAHKAYFRMREHCTSVKHTTDMGLRLILVSITQRTWLSAQSHLTKVEAQLTKAEEKAKIEPILLALNGLASLAQASYRDAAQTFLKTSSQFLNAEPVAGVKWQREVLSGNDVAVYGGLCALASMDRFELQKNVLSNTEFRNFLELEPHIRRAVSLFCNSKYSACLEILEAYRNDYQCDIYLAPLVADIYSRIRTKCIVQYFIPFSCVTLDEMAQKFQTTGTGRNIEDELLDMIKDDFLDARIDLVDRLLISPPTNIRHTVHTDALTMAEKYDNTLRLRLTRLNMQNAGLEVRTHKGGGLDSKDGHGGDKGDSSFTGGLRGLGSKMGFT